MYIEGSNESTYDSSSIAKPVVISAPSPDLSSPTDLEQSDVEAGKSVNTIAGVDDRGDPSEHVVRSMSPQPDTKEIVDVETQVERTNTEQKKIATETEAHFSEDSSTKPTFLLRKTSGIPQQIETVKSDISGGRMHCSIQLVTFIITSIAIMVHVSILRLSIKTIALVLHAYRKTQ